MPDRPAPAPQPATDDEIAALFLRGRDVSCAGCGYNRRDGTQADCPECKRKFVPQAPESISGPYTRLGTLIAWMAIASSCTMLLSSASTVWYVRRYGSGAIDSLQVVTSCVYAILAVASLIFAAFILFGRPHQARVNQHNVRRYRRHIAVVVWIQIAFSAIALLSLLFWIVTIA